MSKPDTALKQSIEDGLKAFEHGDLTACSLALFQQLGYRTDKRLDEEDTSPAGFLKDFNDAEILNTEKALVERWETISLLFQVTKDEIVGGNQMRIDFGNNNRFEDSIIESYLFLGLALKDEQYSRTNLSTITRELNKLFAMPVMVTFRYGELMTLAVIDRRLNKRDGSKDVLEKVTLIRDISVMSPHRAHTEILFDLSLVQLYKNHKFSSFEQLHQAWRKTLDSSELNKRFFKELTNWYFWATERVTFPKNAVKDADGKYSPSVIRMITRLIFVWFLKEKGLVPDELFRQRDIEALIHFDTEGEYNKQSSYYKAVLQNLFFATLNQEMNTAKKTDNRKFQAENSGGYNPHFGIANVYRYKKLIKQPERFLELLGTVPFLNGGLFECLDIVETKPKKYEYVDGFSGRKDNPLLVPNELFFSDEHEENLNLAYGTKNKKYKARGIIDILSSYKFTITENTPLEEDIALDPELLGKVFENLLASYNEETRSTARKKTGSFYTPREVVDYMVNESLKLYLLNKLADDDADEDDESPLDEQIGDLLDYKAVGHRFDESQVLTLIQAIDQLKMIDPAVGSGAFPMGILQKLVFLLGKLDPKNVRWRDVQLVAAQRIEDSEAREAAEKGIDEAFERNELDYGRKLYLIEKCVYGVDIQPIAVQIAKLRFFISLIVDQRVNEDDDNRGIRPLPNLETKFVAANTLLNIADESGGNLTLKSPEIEQKEEALKDVRRNHFSARTQKTKQKYRDKDKALREEISELLVGLALPGETATKMSQWNPYDQNAFASFFDSEWMFGVQGGFDVVIGNPPYVRHEGIQALKPELKPLYRAYTGTADLYVYFYEQGLNLLKEGGVLTYISSNKYFRARYGEKLRMLLAEESTLHQIIDFGDAPVFTAIAYPTIVIAQKAKPKDQRVMALNWEMGEPIEQFASVVKKEGFWMPQKELNAKGWQLADDDSLKLLKRLRKMGTPLGKYVKGRFYYGIKTGLNEAFVVDRLTRDRLIAEHPSSEEVLKPFLRGRDVKRWFVDYQDLYLIFTRRGIDIDQYPAIYKYLFQFKKRLTPGKLGGRKAGSYKWYEIQDNIAYWQEFSQPKILYQEIATYQAFAWDTSGAFSNNKTFLIPGADKYLLAVLNSQLIWFFLDKIVLKMAGGTYAMQSIYLSEVPIVDTEAEGLRDSIEVITDYIITLKTASSSGTNKLAVQYFEQILDALVYEIYLPEALDNQDLAFYKYLKKENLPNIEIMIGDKIDNIYAVFQSLYNTDHPIRQNLFALDTVPSIRIIEGKA